MTLLKILAAIGIWTMACVLQIFIFKLEHPAYLMLYGHLAGTLCYVLVYQ